MCDYEKGIRFQESVNEMEMEGYRNTIQWGCYIACGGGGGKRMEWQGNI